MSRSISIFMIIVVILGIISVGIVNNSNTNSLSKIESYSNYPLSNSDDNHLNYIPADIGTIEREETNEGYLYIPSFVPAKYRESVCIKPIIGSGSEYGNRIEGIFSHVVSKILVGYNVGVVINTNGSIKQSESPSFVFFKTPNHSSMFSNLVEDDLKYELNRISGELFISFTIESSSGNVSTIYYSPYIHSFNDDDFSNVMGKYIGYFYFSPFTIGGKIANTKCKFAALVNKTR